MTIFKINWNMDKHNILDVHRSHSGAYSDSGTSLNGIALKVNLTCQRYHDRGIFDLVIDNDNHIFSVKIRITCMFTSELDIDTYQMKRHITEHKTLNSDLSYLISS